MNEWIDELCDLTAEGAGAVLVTVTSVRGSAPREPGAKMIVTEAETIGTIGGGQLEYQCTLLAVRMLESSEGTVLRSFPLGSSMGQCCGGVVDILFEPIATRLPRWLSELRAMHGQRIPAVLVTDIERGGHKRVVSGDAAVALSCDRRGAFIQGGTFYEPVVATDLNIAVFGAGHVGCAVVSALSCLDSNIRWIDSRRNIFRTVPRNVRPVETGTPSFEVAAMPPSSFYLVMTHSHALDFEICDRILRRADARYCGLIGSRSKRRRFETRFRQQGLPQAAIDELVCPIGVGGITGKKPAEIAVAVAAEVLRTYEAAAGTGVDYPENVRPLNR